MKLQVWKFPIRGGRDFAVEMPVGARVLSVDVQRGEPQIWALVDPAAQLRPHRFLLYGTGHDIDADALDGHEFVGTFLVEGGAFVFHLWARKAP